MMDELDRIMADGADYYYAEGDDGAFAWEIYQYVLKLQEIQKKILRWAPPRSIRHVYHAFEIESENLMEDKLEDHLYTFLNQVENEELLRTILWVHRHPISPAPKYVFEYDYERK